MKTGIAHIQFIVKAENLSFYRDLFGYWGWNEVYADDSMLGLYGKNGEGLWFTAGGTGVTNDYDGAGMNHLAIGAESQADVDAAGERLTAQGIDLLFDTPRHRPEFSGGPDETYYQIMFESPDRILFEFVYTGPREQESGVTKPLSGV
jgi:catechol 2,3-dioxygenase-like lactoylglutathione lyase family enzyme